MRLHVFMHGSFIAGRAWRLQVTEAKSIQHMYYDVARAKSEDELLDKPIFA